MNGKIPRETTKSGIIMKKTKPKKILKGKKELSLTTLILLVVILIFTYFNQKDEKPTVETDLVTVKVVSITDGDTVKYLGENGEEVKLRLIGVNTPEKGRPYYQEATDYTKRNLLNKTVYLEFDVAPQDKYQRTLAYVWLMPPVDVDNPTEEEIRTNMYNAKIILDGYANVMTIQPNVKYQSYFINYEREAREKNLGLWK